MVDEFNAAVAQIPYAGYFNEADRTALARATEPLIAAFVSSSPEDRRLMRSQLTPAANHALVVYAGRLAQTALKLDSPRDVEVIERAFAAMALVDKGNDFRDSVAVLDGIWNIVRRLKIGPKLFASSQELRNEFLNLTRRKA